MNRGSGSACEVGSSLAGALEVARTGTKTLLLVVGRIIAELVGSVLLTTSASVDEALTFATDEDANDDSADVTFAEAEVVETCVDGVDDSVFEMNANAPVELLLPDDVEFVSAALADAEWLCFVPTPIATPRMMINSTIPATQIASRFFHLRLSTSSS